MAVEVNLLLVVDDLVLYSSRAMERRAEPSRSSSGIMNLSLPRGCVMLCLGAVPVAAWLPWRNLFDVDVLERSAIGSGAIAVGPSGQTGQWAAVEQWRRSERGRGSGHIHVTGGHMYVTVHWQA